MCFRRSLAGFALAEYSVFRFSFRRETLVFSLSEIPLAFALVYLAPIPALIIRAARRNGDDPGCSPASYLQDCLEHRDVRRRDGAGIRRLPRLVELGGNTDTVLVLAAIAVAIVMGFLSSTIVGIAISRFEGGLWQWLVGEFGVAWWLFIVNATLAGMVLGLALISPWLLLVALIPVGLLWYIIRAYGAVDQRLRDLDAVHGFTGRVGQSLDPRTRSSEPPSPGLRKCLRTDGAAVVVFGDARTHRWRTFMGRSMFACRSTRPTAL